MNKQDLLNGICEYPGIRIPEKYPDQTHDIERFWNALWYTFLNDSSINGIYWYDQLGPALLNEILLSGHQNGWLWSNAKPGISWIEVSMIKDNLLKVINESELLSIKLKHKHKRYMMENTESRNYSWVKSPYGKLQTGLVRKGFAEAGKSEFMIDSDMLRKYEVPTVKYLNKGMEKMLKIYPEIKSVTSYDSTQKAIVKKMIRSTDIYTTGSSGIDPRGRAISDVQRKAANPISDKNIRALLVIIDDKFEEEV